MKDKPLINRVRLASAKTDGKKVTVEVEVFDGEHTTSFEKDFGMDVESKELMEYMKDFIEEIPDVPEQVRNLLNNSLYFDAEQDGYYLISDNGTKQRIKEKGDKSDSGHTTHSTHHTAHKK